MIARFRYPRPNQNRGDRPQSVVPLYPCVTEKKGKKIFKSSRRKIRQFRSLFPRVYVTNRIIRLQNVSRIVHCVLRQRLIALRVNCNRGRGDTSPLLRSRGNLRNLRAVWRIQNLYFRSAESQACAPIYTCHVTRVYEQARVDRGPTFIFRNWEKPRATARRVPRAREFRARKNSSASASKNSARYRSENYFVVQSKCSRTLKCYNNAKSFEILNTSSRVIILFLRNYFQICVQLNF